MAIGYDTNVVTGDVESLINKLIKDTRDQMYIIEDLVIMLPDFQMKKLFILFLVVIIVKSVRC